MELTYFGYCGLSCTTCQARFADIRIKINELEVAFEEVNMRGMAKAIPFMNYKYRGYKKLTEFF